MTQPDSDAAEPPADAAATALTSFQVEVARLFFSLPVSAGFLLAGGAALAAHRLTIRPTQDLDFFTSPGRGDVAAARDALEAAAATRGWTVQRVRDTATFCRLVVTGTEGLLIDLAVDAPPGRPATASIAGPTFDPDELAGRKMLALFDRADARDFADVYALVGHYDSSALLSLAADTDAGFDPGIFAQAIATLTRFTDADLPVPADQIAMLRTLFAAWASELSR